MGRFFLLMVAVLSMATAPLYAQLNNFTIGATATPQTCLGNGSLTFTVSGNNPAATMAFSVYLLPNTTTPYTTVTGLSAPNLVAGEYLIIATQSLNGQSNTAQVNAVIADNSVLLVYNLSVTDISCNTSGSITVNVTSGTATQYEILTGPVTVAPQASNVFNGLPAGQYQVRVHDNCGDAFVTTVQLVEQTGGIQLFTDTTYQQQTSCNTLQVRHYVLSQGPVVYPLTLTYTVYPPGGGTPTVITNTVTALPMQGDVYADLPFYYGQAYYYTVKITDGCGNFFITNNISMFRIAQFSLGVAYDGCDPAVLVATPNEVFTYPVTASFTQAPEGFNPSDYNPDYPVFDTADQAMAYTIPNQPLPFGDYTMVLTDACGRTVQMSKTVGPNNLEPIIEASSGCVTGSVQISLIEKDAEILNIISAPDAYEQTLPASLLEFATGLAGVYDITGLPPGVYTVYIKDTCGFEFTRTFTIVTAPVVVYSLQMPGCDEGYGSVRLIPNDVFTEFSITGAPEGFTETLPYDAMGNVTAEGFLAMAGLQEGDYTYTYTTESCSEQNTGLVTVVGYHEVTDLDVIPNCGSFDLQLSHSSTITNSGQTYWLQRYDEATGNWGHPETGVPDVAGMPHPVNSISILNNFTNLNFPYTGQFRILKVFYVFQTGNSNYSTCVKTIAEFTFTGVPEIIAIYSFPCDNGLAEVIVDAVGKDPLTYHITSKGGQDFTVNNGQSNVFTGLEAAVYNFRVIDDCNNVVNVLYDVSVLQPMAVESDITCTGEAGSMWLPQFQFLEYEWYKSTNPGTVLSTTHRLDFAPFTAADAGTYVVHVVSDMPGSCIDMVLEYTLEEIIAPQAGQDATALFCGAGAIVNLEDYLTGEYDTGGTWQDVSNTGALAGSTVVTDGIGQGDYLFTYTVTRCDAQDTATVTLSILGPNTFPVVLEKGCVDNRFIISIANIDEISNIQLLEWYGPGGFAQTGVSAIDITGLAGGEYYAVVTNADGCTSTSEALTVPNTRCDIPKGVSPNGDQWNNSFDLSHLDVVHLVIFNRYGLKVYEANEYVNEWHGQSDAGDLSTGTYYYVVTLVEGGQKTGWVYLQTEEK